MLAQPARTSGDVDKTPNRRPRLIARRSTEKKNPQNTEFERRVAALEYRQEEQRKRAASSVRLVFMPSLSSHSVENGDDQLLPKSTSLLDGLEPSASSSFIIFHLDGPEESLRRFLINSSRTSLEDSQQSDKAPDNDFLVNTFSNTSVDMKRTTRKKSKKKNKRHKKGHGKKVSEASEIQSMQSKDASHCIDVASGESLTLSSDHVVDAGSEMRCRKETFPSMVDGGENFPLTLPPNHVADKFFGDLSSHYSAREVSVERPDSETGNDGSFITLISSTSCSDEIELSTQACYFECCEQSSSNNSRCLDSSSTSTLTDSSLDGHYTDSSWNFSDDTENLLIDKNECPCIQLKLTDFTGFKCGGNEGWLNKSNHDKYSCFRNSAGGCCGTQEMQLCSNAGSDGDFLPVISKKRARKNRKMQLLGSCNVEHICGVEHGQSGNQSNRSSRPSNICTQVASKDSTKDFIHPIKVRTWTPHEVTLNDYMLGANMNHLLYPKQNRRGKPHKCSRLSEVANNGFIEEKSACTAKMLPGIMHSTETDVGQMASSSASDVMVQEISEKICTPIGPPVQKGGLQVLLQEENVAIGTGSLDALNHVSSVDPKEQKKVDNAVSSRLHDMEGDLQAQDAGSQFPGCTTDYWKTSRPTEGGLEVGCHGVSAFEGHCNLNQQRFVSSKLQLGGMIKAANDACKVQGASDVHLISGHPLADFEIFLYSATPVIAETSCMGSGNCLQDHTVDSSPCQYQISNVSLRNVWEWYEEPGSYGLEVEIHKSLNSTNSTSGVSEFCAYFLPSLSAIQLFEQSKNKLDRKFDGDDENLLLSPPNGACLPKPSLSVQDHGELLFEYFELEHPSSRPSLFEKIKQLTTGENLSTCQIFGDPKMLENLKLCDLHPASWFCVAWYPICRIPQGSCRAAFLTYHSLGKVVPQIRSPDKADELTRFVSPVVGFWSYNDKGEQWFQLRDPEVKPMSLGDAPKADRAEVLKERLKTLRHGASVMSNMVIPKANREESINRHPDYEFFLSRSN
ncbi:hypothetical protein E2562_005170 [Oryza meyeriana var. granulata]|uniref:Uncharacterized protein n=1 Tax=Oryza meyeriana var. granulata TaxID=110450 RepID=A0A6G1BSV2_9ORYZ|nr:hypothetical protein E2562_005170 [Oryza meyeriana var. granulata]KAF0891089.1 hypothetical protein E2562_005170 [Oryza meyeriana var. granulata]